MNNLIEWCDDLDYEKYIDHWKKLATSAYSEVKLDVISSLFLFYSEYGRVRRGAVPEEQ